MKFFNLLAAMIFFSSASSFYAQTEPESPKNDDSQIQAPTSLSDDFTNVLKNLQQINTTDIANSGFVELSTGMIRAYLNIVLISLIQIGDIGNKFSSLIGWNRLFIGTSAQLLMLTTVLWASLKAVQTGWGIVKKYGIYIMLSLIAIGVIEKITEELAQLSKEQLLKEHESKENVELPDESFSMKIQKLIEVMNHGLKYGQQFLKRAQARISQ